MNNQRPVTILSNAATTVTGGRRGGSGSIPGKPHLARLSAKRQAVASACFPQILWIEVCISCKFDR
jgi:hypothetical protein